MNDKPANYPDEFDLYNDTYSFRMMLPIGAVYRSKSRPEANLVVIPDEDDGELRIWNVIESLPDVEDESEEVDGK